MPQATENIVEKFGPEKVAAGWPKRLFSFSLILFAATVAIYFGLSFGYAPFLESRIAQLEKQIAGLAEQVPAEKQEDFVKFYSQLINLTDLLDNHVFASKIFPVLETYTHPDVYYTSIDLSVPDKRMVIEGAAKDYQTLAAQLEGYKTARKEIVNYAISEANLIEGKVVFKANLSLAPDLFK
jgi:hypothetical protein